MREHGPFNSLHELSLPPKLGVLTDYRTRPPKSKANPKLGSMISMISHAWPKPKKNASHLEGICAALGVVLPNDAIACRMTADARLGQHMPKQLPESDLGPEPLIDPRTSGPNK